MTWKRSDWGAFRWAVGLWEEAAGNHTGNEWLPAYSGIRGPMSVCWGRLSGENRGKEWAPQLGID
ncbi:MAG: hypothetical protein IPH16_04295 [Haliscomenobacter sp.]|nr:hypothetical protein [Haliscomenobacter sp.]